MMRVFEDFCCCHIYICQFALVAQKVSMNWFLNVLDSNFVFQSVEKVLVILNGSLHV